MVVGRDTAGQNLLGNLLNKLTSLVSASALLLGLLVAIPISFTLPTTSNAATADSCDGTSIQNNIKITAVHGKVFYIDSGQNQNIDAAIKLAADQLAATQKAAADVAAELAADQLAASQKIPADPAAKLAADQLVASKKAAATAKVVATTTAKAAATKLAAAQTAAPKSINKPKTSIATSIAPMLLPKKTQDAIITLTEALIKVGTTTKASMVKLPTSKLLVSKILVRTPRICSVSGATVTASSSGTCVMTYTMTTSTGRTVRTMKKITFKL